MAEAERRVAITVVAPRRKQCGVSDYTDYLVAELERLVDVRYVTDPESFTPEMNRIDLVHVQHQYFVFGGVAPWKNRFKRFASRVSAPIVMTVHEFVSPEGAALFRTAVAASNRMTFEHPGVRRLIVHTVEDLGRMMLAGLSGARIAVVRHGVPARPDLPDREAARARLGLEGRFVLTLFGFLSRRKGHLQAIQALRTLPEEPYLLLAGGRHPDDATDYADRLKAAIQENGLTGRARITDYLDESGVLDVMSATDLILAPFAESSGSGSLALAMASGKPILASDIEPHREIVADTPGALALYPLARESALAEEILSLHKSPSRLLALAESAREYATKHTYARAAEETVAVYRSILAEIASARGSRV